MGEGEVLVEVDGEPMLDKDASQALAIIDMGLCLCWLAVCYSIFVNTFVSFIDSLIDLFVHSFIHSPINTSLHTALATKRRKVPVLNDVWNE